MKDTESEENNPIVPKDIQPKRIRVFASAEEQREEMYDYWASLSHEQLMANLLDLIIKTYNLTPEMLKNPPPRNKITITRHE